VTAKRSLVEMLYLIVVSCFAMFGPTFSNRILKDVMSIYKKLCKPFASVAYNSCRSAWYEPLIGRCAIHGCIHLSRFRFRLILSLNADNTIVAATAKSLSVSSAMFLVRETWMVLCATCIQDSCIKFLVWV